MFNRNHSSDTANNNIYDAKFSTVYFQHNAVLLYGSFVHWVSVFRHTESILYMLSLQVLQLKL